MASVCSLYRYPIKGLNAEALTIASLRPGRGFAGDRAYAIAHGRTEFDPEHPVHLGKIKFLSLMTHPRLAELRLETRPGGDIRLYRHGALVLETSLLTADGIAAFDAYMLDFIGDQAKGAPKLVTAPGHMFSDVREDCMSIINLASVRALGAALGCDLDPLRFRANIYVDGFAPWAERSWQAGDLVRIGGNVLEVMRPIVRCAATNVNLATAMVDADVPKALGQLFEKNLMGIYANVITGGDIVIGDPVDHKGQMSE